MRMKEKQHVDYLTIDTSEYKYTLLIGEDVYYAQSIWSLIMEVLTAVINRRWMY
jgi:hypothetical protein